MTTPAAAPATKELTTYQKKVATVRDLFERSKPQIKLALPRHLSPERLLRIAMTSVQKNPTLLECDQMSLLGAVIQAAQLGLEPDGVLGHAYLVPFGKEVTLIPGYRGLVDLARRSGQLSTIYAEVVHEKDAFDYELGLNPKLTHKPTEEEDPGAMTHVYAVAKLRDGGEQFVVLSKRQVMAIRSKSRGANSKSSPWNGTESDQGEMWKKTAIRRLSKMLPLSVELARLAELHDRAEMGESQNLRDIIDASAVEEPSPAPGEKTLDQLAAESEREMAK